ncbi:hypothetical protein [Leucothrix mucor]|uniref:hypothetical protein n=1 Tax=Leucothrix mucor TaxID=45248 RepID=UPI0003B5D1F7|nr:hypothetical protein [Leucothrix mucor]
MSKPEAHDSKRRAFLRGSVAAGAGATLVATGTATASPEPTIEVTKEEKPARKGYRVTDHVAAYYRTLSS